MTWLSTTSWEGSHERWGSRAVWEQGVAGARERTRRRRGLGLWQPREAGPTPGLIGRLNRPLPARAQCEPSAALLSSPTWNSAPRGSQLCNYSVRWLRRTSQRFCSGCELPVSDQSQSQTAGARICCGRWPWGPRVRPEAFHGVAVLVSALLPSRLTRAHRKHWQSRSPD